MFVNILIALFSLVFFTPLFAAETTTSVTQTIETPNSNTDATTTTVITTSKTTDNELDLKIIASINKQIAASSVLTGTTVTASSKAGVVTLSGTVTTQSQADEAVRIVRGTEGVNDVISEIIVKTHTDPTLRR